MDREDGSLQGPVSSAKFSPDADVVACPLCCRGAGERALHLGGGAISAPAAFQLDTEGSHPSTRAVFSV